MQAIARTPCTFTVIIRRKWTARLDGSLSGGGVSHEKAGFGTHAGGNVAGLLVSLLEGIG